MKKRRNTGIWLTKSIKKKLALCFETVKRLSVFFIILLCGYSPLTLADESYSGNVRAQLVSDTSNIAAGKTFWVGLRMIMDEGWHTYWQNPGDSGMATGIQWELPDGFEAGDLHWPYPARFDYYEGLTSYGHEGEIVLLTEMKAPQSLDERQEYRIGGKARWLSCEKICVPGTAVLSVAFEAQKGEARIHEDIHQLFKKTRERWPVHESAWHMAVLDKDDQFLLNITSNGPVSGMISEAAFFPIRNDVIDHAGQQIFSKTPQGYELRIPKSSLLEEKITHIQGVLVSPAPWLDDGTRHSLAVDVSVK